MPGDYELFASELAERLRKRREEHVKDLLIQREAVDFRRVQGLIKGLDDCLEEMDELVKDFARRF